MLARGNPRFEFIRFLGYYPKDILSTFLNDLLSRANSPFSNHDDRKGCSTTENADMIYNNDLAYFPQIPKVCHRRFYRTDKNTSGAVCKKRSAHPSLPGVFTLFCQHSNDCTVTYICCTQVSVVLLRWCALQSPDVLFTVIYERFPTGYLRCINTII